MRQRALQILVLALVYVLAITVSVSAERGPAIEIFVAKLGDVEVRMPLATGVGAQLRADGVPNSWDLEELLDYSASVAADATPLRAMEDISYSLYRTCEASNNWGDLGPLCRSAERAKIRLWSFSITGSYVPNAGTKNLLSRLSGWQHTDDPAVLIRLGGRPDTSCSTELRTVWSATPSSTKQLGAPTHRSSKGSVTRSSST